MPERSRSPAAAATRERATSRRRSGRRRRRSALDRGRVEVVGALPPIGTFVTNYKVHPIVGLIEPELEFDPNPAEVETVLAFGLAELQNGFAMRRLVRRGLPIRTPTYVVADHLIWGATARILGELIGRLPVTE